MFLGYFVWDEIFPIATLPFLARLRSRLGRRFMRRKWRSMICLTWARKWKRRMRSLGQWRMFSTKKRICDMCHEKSGRSLSPQFSVCESWKLGFKQVKKRAWRCDRHGDIPELAWFKKEQNVWDTNYHQTVGIRHSKECDIMYPINTVQFETCKLY